MKRLLTSLAFLGAASGAAAAQQPATPQPAAAPVNGTPLSVGADAPDFTLSSATKEGLAGPVRLADLRDKTVVIAFFFRARTSG